MRNTPCECPAAGWCERHRCLKPEHLFQQCRRNQTMFEEWEARRGPCFPVPEDSAETTSSGEIPGLAQRIANFGAAAVRHAANGFHQVSDTIRDERLAICRECPSCDTARMICRERTCGCYLTVKARWASEVCPLEKWPDAPSP